MNIYARVIAGLSLVFFMSCNYGPRIHPNTCDQDKLTDHPYAPAYDPVKWQRHAYRSNCYSYAFNDTTFHDNIFWVPSPGHASGFTVVYSETKMVCMYDYENPVPVSTTKSRTGALNTIIGCIMDGARFAGTNVQDQDTEGYYKAALYIAPDQNFHFIRENRHGGLSHQTGRHSDIECICTNDFPAYYTDTLSNGAPRMNDFVCYVEIPEGGLNVGWEHYDEALDQISWIDAVQRFFDDIEQYIPDPKERDLFFKFVYTDPTVRDDLKKFLPALHDELFLTQREPEYRF